MSERVSQREVLLLSHARDCVFALAEYFDVSREAALRKSIDFFSQCLWTRYSGMEIYLRAEGAYEPFDMAIVTPQADSEDIFNAKVTANSGLWNSLAFIGQIEGCDHSTIINSGVLMLTQAVAAVSNGGNVVIRDPATGEETVVHLL